MKRVLVLVLLTLSVGCASTTRFTPKTPEEAAAYANYLATTALKGVRDAGLIATDIRKAEQVLHAQHVITDAQHAAFDGKRCDPPAPAGCVESGFLRLQHVADQVIARLSNPAGMTAGDLGVALQPLWNAAVGLASNTAGGQLSYTVLLAVLQSILALVGRA